MAQRNQGAATAFVCLWLVSCVAAYSNGIPLRYLGINVGNAGEECWESKLCVKEVVDNIRSYIQTWQPDLVLIAEAYRAGQLLGTDMNGPILPPGYDGICGRSIDRFTEELAAYNASDSSHEHECIGWKPSRFEFVPNSNYSVYGRNDAYGQKKCHYDFTAFHVDLLLQNTLEIDQYTGQIVEVALASPVPITAVAVHPNSQVEECRLYEIAAYWSQLANSSSNTIIGVDWNSGQTCVAKIACKDTHSELQKPADFIINYSVGQHWNIYNDTSEQPTAVYLDGMLTDWYDNEFSNFGSPCTDCGSYYGTIDLPHGSAVGGYNGMPRADGGEGCDHRQVLVDMWLTGDNARGVSMA